MMTYEKAAALVATHAPGWFIDPPVPGQQHVNLRKTEDSPPHSIMLPAVMDQDEDECRKQEERLFLQAVHQAKTVL